MGGGRRFLCWNCETELTRDELRDSRCPHCSARNDPPAVYVFLVLTFLGVVVGWLGGAVYGAIGAAVGWEVDWRTAGQAGAILGAIVLGGLGLLTAFVLAFCDGMAGWDKGIRERGDAIRRQRAERQDGASRT